MDHSIPLRPEGRPSTPFPLEREREKSTEAPPLQEVTAELEEHRSWLAKIKAQQELTLLQELKKRYESGDTSVLDDLDKGAALPARPAAPSAHLPRPEPPQVYHKKNRMEYNRWERDCEGFFTRAPSSFVTEQQKVDFGVMYISETLKTLWRTYCASQASQDVSFGPTWPILKTTMLNALGTPVERRMQAHASLKGCKQRLGQSPTELLDYMRPLWEELGEASTASMQVLEFTAALSEEIQKDLFLLPPERRATLSQVEEQAQVIYRRRPTQRPQHGQKGQDRRADTSRNSENMGGDRKTPKRRQGANLAHPGPKRPRDTSAAGHKANVTCYSCGERGHYSDKCPRAEKSDKSGKDASAGQPGKGRGQRS